MTFFCWSLVLWLPLFALARLCDMSRAGMVGLAMSAAMWFGFAAIVAFCVWFPRWRERRAERRFFDDVRRGRARKVTS